MDPRHASDEARRRVRQFIRDEAQTALSLSGLGLRELPIEVLEELMTSGAGMRVVRLDLANNTLTDLPELLADALPNLRVLFCLKNNFETIPACLRRCAALFMLSFKSCRLRGELDTRALPPHLGWLILTDNQITALGADFGSRACNVRKLMLANNLLTTLPPNMMAFGLASSLELLRLSNNRLHAVPECIFKARKLSWLGLGGNPCSADSVRSLDELDQTARIDMDDFELEEHPSLGRGASGDVYCAARRDGDGDFEYAVKVYRSSVTSDGNVLDEMRAALALRSVHGLIPVLGYFGGQVGQAGDARFGILMKAIYGMQSLATTPSFASVSRDIYPEDGLFARLEPALRIATQVARTACQMHKLRYAHGDLYGHNILISKSGDSHGCLLTDLGAAFPYTDPRIELVEVRAFGCLVEELVRATAESVDDIRLRKAMAGLVDRCLSDLHSRPAFCEIAVELNDMVSLVKSVPSNIDTNYITDIVRA